ncbi:MAG: bifunctional UDP-N-acetylmuramoyl-tripeptide:D-alanyl-D-alanine ligase/alanine racemase [Bacteroidetes bacterium]|nr:bifunctional UDP-N-acetylmuramoyl-tripeptide:D-alanyl-D-alanine ligase/alanine racemase [Bacteroidota bacterium]
MHSYSFSEICSLLRVTPLQKKSDPIIEVLLTDSRKLLIADKVMFFALSTAHVDANPFIISLYERGVRNFLSDDRFDKALLSILPEANVLLVKDVLEALQVIAAAHRHQFHYPVIGITGSNGKTIVKEWLSQLLSNKYNVVKSPKSYNSQVGVPLSVWQMNDTHTVGIFEAGISMKGEMERLQKIIDPEIGVITFIGEAHAEGFNDVREKIEEKLQLFVNSKMLIYGSDDDVLHQEVMSFKQNRNNSIRLFTWSRNAVSDLFISNIENKDNGSIVHAQFKGDVFSFFIPFTDIASIHNAISCCCVMLCMQETIASIALHMNELRTIEMRLELKQGINNCSIINDSYSADIDSLQIALDFLSQQQQHQKRTVILSDLLQSGLSDDLLYQKISSIISHQHLHRFIGIGPKISSKKQLFENIPGAAFFSATDEFLQAIPLLHFNDETILLKAARVFRFEKISSMLEQKVHETVLEINLNSLRNNLKVYREQLKPGVKLMVMVKAFSYGSGSFEIASLLQHAGVDYLAVAYADEGVELRKSGIRLPIMVMNTEIGGFDKLIQYKLEPELYSFNILMAFDSYLKQHNIPEHPVHIKLDTGMHRLGFVETDVNRLTEMLSAAKQFKIKSVFSHLVASDDERHDAFTKEQGRAFLKMAEEIEKNIGYRFLKHIGNTSAIHRHPEFQFDMVRLGIGLYGVDEAQQLQNVTTLRTTISQIKQVVKGESVGYSRRGIVNRDSVIATVRIGYADGYSRILGNGAGKMLVNGELVPVIGNVCMDMTMLDITGITAAEGDEVVVFGEDLPVTEVAKWAQTIPYEILTNISQRVKRVYYEE